jgi:1-aminocyclopropane-1-carboxylate deaminase
MNFKLNQQIFSERYLNNEIEVFIKRLDLIDPFISGNKLFKLKHNVDRALLEEKNMLITFGGAFSNHILATAAYAKKKNIDCLAIVRGEEYSELNPLLALAKEYGMNFCFVSRKEYAKRNDNNYISELIRKYKKAFIVPEGGNNKLGVLGAEEILETQDKSFDYIICPIGTGATLSGIVNSSNRSQKVIGINCINDTKDINKNISQKTNKNNWEIINEFNFGGFAKFDNLLTEYLKKFKLNYKITLDLNYTTKMFFGFEKLIERRYFHRKSKVLLIHTGGTYGNLGFNYLYDLDLPHESN